MSHSRKIHHKSANEIPAIERALKAYDKELTGLGDLWTDFDFKWKMAKGKVINSSIFDELENKPSCISKKKIIGNIKTKMDFDAFLGVLNDVERAKSISERIRVAYDTIKKDPSVALLKAKEEVKTAVCGARHQVDEKTQDKLTQVVEGGIIREEELLKHNNKLSDRNTKLENENQEYRHEKEKWRKKCEEREEENDKLKNENKDEEHKQQIIKLIKEKEKIEKEMNGIKKEKDKVEKENRRLKAENRTNQEKIKNLEGQLDCVQQKLDRLEQRPNLTFDDVDRMMNNKLRQRESKLRQQERPSDYRFQYMMGREPFDNSLPPIFKPDVWLKSY